MEREGRDKDKIQYDEQLFCLGNYAMSQCLKFLESTVPSDMKFER